MKFRTILLMILSLSSVCSVAADSRFRSIENNAEFEKLMNEKKLYIAKDALSKMDAKKLRYEIANGSRSRLVVDCNRGNDFKVPLDKAESHWVLIDRIEVQPNEQTYIFESKTGKLSFNCSSFEIVDGKQRPASMTPALFEKVMGEVGWRALVSDKKVQPTDFGACYSLVKEFKFKAIYQTIYEAAGVISEKHRDILKARLQEPVAEMRLDPGIESIDELAYNHNDRTARLSFSPEEGSKKIEIMSRVDKNGVIHVSNLDSEFQFLVKDNKCIPLSFHFKEADPKKDWELKDCEELNAVLGELVLKPQRKCSSVDLGWRTELKIEIIRGLTGHPSPRTQEIKKSGGAQ